MQQRRGRELPNQWDQPVVDVGRIVSIALELGLEGLFLEHRPHGVRQIAETTQPIRYDFLFGSCIGSTADMLSCSGQISLGGHAYAAHKAGVSHRHRICSRNQINWGLVGESRNLRTKAVDIPPTSTIT